PVFLPSSATVNDSDGTPFRCRYLIICSADGPGTPVPPVTVRTVTRSALSRSGIERATARACSVLPFHAINTLVPIFPGGDGGHRSSGRPLSNRADSSTL